MMKPLWKGLWQFLIKTKPISLTIQHSMPQYCTKKNKKQTSTKKRPAQNIYITGYS